MATMSGDAEKVVFPSVLRFTSVEFDDVGFRSATDPADVIPWSEITQVAVAYEIHPIAIVDDYYVAFRLRREDRSVWVVEEENVRFLAEVEKRFASFAGLEAVLANKKKRKQTERA